MPGIAFVDTKAILVRKIRRTSEANKPKPLYSTHKKREDNILPYIVKFEYRRRGGYQPPALFLISINSAPWQAPLAEPAFLMMVFLDKSSFGIYNKEKDQIQKGWGRWNVMT